MLTVGKVLEEWKREKALRAAGNKGQVLPLRQMPAKETVFSLFP
ncbi:hypothetical protein [Roseateles sp.]